MKSSQKNYLTQRLGEIQNKKLAELKGYYRVGHTLSEVEMLKMVYSGEVTVNKSLVQKAILSKEAGVGYYGSGSLHFFDFTGKIEAMNPDVEAHKKAQELLAREFEKVRDEIMLGSENGAVELLRSLENLNLNEIVSKHPPVQTTTSKKKPSAKKATKK